jgi:hypothetical protein
MDNDRYADERSVSPASYNAAPSFSRSASWSQQDGGAKKLAPPPPPSRYVLLKYSSRLNTDL